VDSSDAAPAPLHTSLAEVNEACHAACPDGFLGDNVMESVLDKTRKLHHRFALMPRPTTSERLCAYYEVASVGTPLTGTKRKAFARGF